jgi:pheromone shutdown protein TraB
MHNHSIQRAGTSRSGQWHIERLRRLVPAADARRWSRIMKCVERIVLAAGFILAFAAGLSLLFCVVLVGSAVSKGYRVLQFVGYWPLFTVVLSVVSGLFLLGAPRLARAIGKGKRDEEDPG